MAARFPLAESCAVLVEVCTEINCPVTEHEIKHPTPAKVQTVYEAWMTKFLEINIDDCVRVAQEQLDQMDYHVSTCPAGLCLFGDFCDHGNLACNAAYKWADIMLL